MQEQPEYPEQLAVLLEQIRSDVEQTASYTGRRTLKPEVYDAISGVNREQFVAQDETRLAWVNAPLPIGCGQTISQPFIVALMTDLLDIAPDARVLEIGTGSGYQSAVLAEVAKEVFSVEFVPELCQSVRERLRKMGYENIRVRCGNGRLGWADHAPYDGIIVTAASPDIPPALIKQIKPGGNLVIPLEEGRGHQQLVRIHKGGNGEIHRRDVLPVAFVPLVG